MSFLGIDSLASDWLNLMSILASCKSGETVVINYTMDRKTYEGAIIVVATDYG